jgi:hypothetical protein
MAAILLLAGLVGEDHYRLALIFFPVTQIVETPPTN